MQLMLQVSRADTYRTEAQLAGFARRLSLLLEHEITQKSPAVAGTLDEFLGVLYGLNLAVIQGFEHRPQGKSIEIDVLKRRARDLTDGKVRIDGKWIAGFHFNNALLRLSAVFHRTLKIVTGNIDARKDVPTLLRERDRSATEWRHENIEKVHSEVNAFKHTAEGLNQGRNVPFVEAAEAVEELLTLLEKWLPRS
jgi:hypothetical protein